MKSLGTATVFRNSRDAAAFEENKIPIYWQLIIALEVAHPFDCIVELLLKAGPGIWPGMGRAASGESAGRLRTLSQRRCFMKETVRDDLVLAFTPSACHVQPTCLISLFTLYNLRFVGCATGASWMGA